MKNIFFLLIIAYQALFYTNLLQASCSQSHDPNVFKIHGTEKEKAVIEGDCLNELLTAMGEGKNIDIEYAEIKGGIDFTNSSFFPARSFDEVEKDLSEDERARYNRIKEVYGEQKIVLVKGDIGIIGSIIDGDITIHRVGRPSVVLILKKGVDFHHTRFAGRANFWSAQFAGWTGFVSAQFDGEANFGSAQFAGKTTFGSAKFAKGADFGSAQFPGGADFGSAQFPGGADFRSAQFDGEAYFGSAKFAKGADFGSAQFDGKAYFRSAQFAGEANFYNANLSGANLHDADMGKDKDKVNLRGANLDSVIFELKPGSLPIIRDIAHAKNLSKVRYEDSQESLVELRKAFKDAEYSQQEREITYAIEHTRRLHEWNKKGVLWKVWSVIKLIIFELTSDYGMSPHRPILYMFILFLICVIPYMIALNTKGEGGIWKILDKERVLKNDEQVELVRLCYKKCRLRGFFRALQFSLLSAFHVGWRDINPGYWIARMQRQEYTLRATGWVRMVSGVQSLISVYLMALSILSYFGRPF